MRVLRLFFVVMSLAYLGACSGIVRQPAIAPVPVQDQSSIAYPNQGQGSGVRDYPGASSTSPEATVFIDDNQPGSGTAVLALLESAEKASQTGRDDLAAAAIERALSLEPKNALLWTRLAGIRLQQQDWQQAYVLAGKSNSLARGDRRILVQNWRIIEQARIGTGDTVGAQAARKRVDQLMNGQ